MHRPTDRPCSHRLRRLSLRQAELAMEPCSSASQPASHAQHAGRACMAASRAGRRQLGMPLCAAGCLSAALLLLLPEGSRSTWGPVLPPAGAPVRSANPLASLPALPKVHYSTDQATNDKDEDGCHDEQEDTDQQAMKTDAENTEKKEELLIKASILTLAIVAIAGFVIVKMRSGTNVNVIDSKDVEVNIDQSDSRGSINEDNLYSNMAEME